MKRLWAPWRFVYIKTMVEKNPVECVFCDIPAHEPVQDREYLLLHRGERVYVVCNKYPYNNGHLLVVPYRHVADMSDLTPDERLESMDLLTLSVDVIRKINRAESFNIGANLGRTAGAGIEQHLHFHVVPRYDGDTNFMPVLGGTKVISQSLEETYDTLKRGFDRLKG